jgi:hypothetical protein
MLFVVAVLAALAGCSPLGDDSGDAPIPEASLPTVVLQPDDLPVVFSRFDEGPLAIADAPTGDRADPARFGRIGGWKARYRRPGSAATVGPLVVESRADLFEGSGGAEQELDAHRRELAPQALHPSTLSLLEIEELGEQGIALTQAAGDAPGTLVSHTVVWRYGNVVASVTANGFGGKLRPAQVLDLAQAQQRRIAAAAAPTSP